MTIFHHRPASILDHVFITNYQRMSIFLRLTGQRPIDVEGNLFVRAFSVSAIIFILVYQIKMEIRGLKADKGILKRIIAILMPVVFLMMSFYSVGSNYNTDTIPDGAQISGVIVFFTGSVILPIMFISSHDNMRQFVKHKIFSPAQQDPPICLSGVV